MSDTTKVPIFDIGDHFDTTVTIGGRPVPIHVKRFSRTEIDATRKQWVTLFAAPGEKLKEFASDSPEAHERSKFLEQLITEYVTVEEGVLKNRGHWVTNGAGLVEMFYAVAGALFSVAMAVIARNTLDEVLVKNLPSPRDSERTSEPSSPARGGDKPDSTATSADPSTSVSSAAAAENASATESPSSSGAGSKVH